MVSCWKGHELLLSGKIRERDSYAGKGKGMLDYSVSAGWTACAFFGLKLVRWRSS